MKLYTIYTFFLLTGMLGCGNSENSSSFTLTEILPEGYISVTSGRFSPDGTQLAMHATKENDQGEQEGHLITTNLQGEDVKVWVINAANDNTPPAWTPDGQALIYAYDGIMRIDLRQGAMPQKLYKTDSKLYQVGAIDGINVSPDGKTLYWSAVSPEGISFAPIQTDPSRVRFRPLNLPSGARLSPDGSRVLYLLPGIGFKTVSASLTGSLQDIDTNEVSYLSNADWIDDENIMALTEDKIRQINVSTGKKTTVFSDGFAAKNLDVSPNGKDYLFGLNGQPFITLHTFN